MAFLRFGKLGGDDADGALTGESSAWDAGTGYADGASQVAASHTVVGGWDSDDGATAESWTEVGTGESEVNPLVRTSPTRHVGFFLTRTSTGETFEVAGPRFALGKSREASYQLRGNAAISRVHAELSVVGDELWLEDAGSTNGTFVNGARVAPRVRVKLEAGAAIMLGDDELVLEVRTL